LNEEGAGVWKNVWKEDGIRKTKRFEMKPNEKHHRKSQSYPAAGSFYNPLSLGMDKVCSLCLART